MKHWIAAARLRTLPLALACIGMGGVLAYRDGLFEGRIFGLTLLTAFLLQILSNFANDYGDSMNGADNAKRGGPTRAVQTGEISAVAMRNAVVVFALLSLASGMALLRLSISSWMELGVFFGTGLLCILAAITYTMGKNPYGYVGFGDISVLLFFGFVAVLGTYYLQTDILPWHNILPAATCGLFAVGVLNVNNIRDIESDRMAGKYSIPVRLGRRKAVYYHWALLTIAWAGMVAFILMNGKGMWDGLFLLSLPLFAANARAVHIHREAQALDPYLKQMAISTLVFVLLFAVSSIGS